MNYLDFLLTVFTLAFFLMIAMACYLSGLLLVALIFCVIFLFNLYLTVKKLFFRKG